MKTEDVSVEELKVGDVIMLWCGTKRITAITPYKGPLVDIVFAVVHYEPGPTTAITLCKGDRFPRVVF